MLGPMQTIDPQDELRVYDAYVAGRLSAGLAAGVRTGLFDVLDADGPLSCAALAEASGLHERGVRAWLAAMQAGQLVQEVGSGDFALTPAAARDCVRNKPGSLAGLIDMEIENFLSPALVIEGLRGGGPCVYGDSDPWAEHAADPAKARAFSDAMHAIACSPALALAERAPLENARRLLDAGGGSGTISVALARAFPQLHCTVLEIPAVLPHIEERAREEGLEQQISALQGDLFAQAWPTGFDAVLLSQIMHDWSDDEGARLLRRAYNALNPGGTVLIHEKLIEPDGGPLANALVNLDMLVWTEGRQWSATDLEQLMQQAGFEGVQAQKTYGYWSLVSATKPG